MSIKRGLAVRDVVERVRDVSQRTRTQRQTQTHDERSDGHFVALEFLDGEDTVEIVLAGRCILVRSRLGIRLG